MDVIEVRQNNLRYLIGVLATRTKRQKDIAQMLGGFSPAHFSQLKAGARIGEQVARRIEGALRKEHGWMDRPQWPGAVEEREGLQLLPDEQRLLDLYKKATPKAKAMILAVAEASATAAAAQA